MSYISEYLKLIGDLMGSELNRNLDSENLLEHTLKISIEKKLYKTFIKKTTFLKVIAYKNDKRLLNTLVRRTNREHYADLFNQHKGNTRKT